ncbi:MAG: NifU family protein, partial [Spirochaetales bacterium]|nr:NifU family protein [Spirochaetales bacterium]
AVPAQKMHCSVMAYDVIKRAVSKYKKVDFQVLENEDIVCECARVSLGTIKEVIRINNLKTVEEITRFTKAGAFCKSCVRPGGHEERKFYLVDILEETRAEMRAEELHGRERVLNFPDMTLIQKHKAVEDVLSEKIRPLLQADGGNMEVVDMKDEEGKTTVYISYSGTCAGCASSRSGTLYAIEYSLQEELDKNIRVVIV